MFARDSKKKQSKQKQLKFLCLALCLSSFILSLEFSSSSFGIYDFLIILWKKLKAEPLSSELKLAENILINIRLPRLLVASLCGASLGVAGVVSQGLFRNALASPSLIGSTSGATLGAVLCFYYGQAWYHTLSLSFFAMTGALSTSSLLLLIYTKLKNLSLAHLLLIGLTFSTLSNALCSLIISLEDSNPYKSFAIYRWLLGGFYSIEWSHFKLSVVPLVFAIAWAFKLAKKLDILCLGEEIAQSLGVEIKKLKISCLLVLSLILGFITSVAGAIPFLGLIAPHITRTLIGSHHKDLMKYTLLNSVSLILIADMIAKKAFAHKELELGIILSLIGCPFFLYLILRKKNFEAA